MKEVRIVLVRPRNPLNIAAAARAAQNFGFDDLVVVAPYAPVWDEAKAAASGRWLRHARSIPQLTEAIEDRNWVLGTSSLARRRPPETHRVLSLEALVEYSKRQKGRERAAILFGSEKRGLTNEDLGYCHAILRIPTVSRAGSMNLGQAVAVCCYELRHLLDASRVRKPSKNAAADSCAPMGEIGRLIDELELLLRETSPVGNLLKRKKRLRQMLMRRSWTSQELALLLGVVRDLSRKLKVRHQ